MEDIQVLRETIARYEIYAENNADHPTKQARTLMHLENFKKRLAKALRDHHPQKSRLTLGNRAHKIG